MASQPNLQLCYGPMFLGFCFNIILYGGLVVQMVRYYQGYRGDRAWIRYMMLYYFLIETASTAFHIAMVFKILVLGSSLTPTRLFVNSITTVIISTPVQLFMAWRIKVICGSKLITGIISFLAFCSVIGGVLTSAFAPRGSVVIRTKLPPTVTDSDGPVITWLASSAVADVIITVSLVYTLYRRRSGIRATDDVVNRIIRLSVETGMLTSIAAIVDVVLFIASPKIPLYFIPDFALSKLYVNSLLATLNTRPGPENSVGSVTSVLFVDNHDNALSRPSEKDKYNSQKATIEVYDIKWGNRSNLKSDPANGSCSESGITSRVIRLHSEDQSASNRS